MLWLTESTELYYNPLTHGFRYGIERFDFPDLHQSFNCWPWIRFWTPTVDGSTNTVIDRSRPIPTKIPDGRSGFVCFCAVWHHLLLIGRARGGLDTCSWCPVPPLPSFAWTCHGQRLSPWLVKIARATDICIFVAEADGLNVFIAGSRSELIYFFHMIAVRAWSFPGRYAAIRECGVWNVVRRRISDLLCGFT